MKSYSTDLRCKLVQAYERRLGSQHALAAAFGVSLSLIEPHPGTATICSRDQNAEAGRSSGPRITELSSVGGVAARASATRSLSCAPMVVTTWAPASYRRTPPFTTSRAAGTTRALTTGSSSGAVRTSPSPIKLVETTEPRVTSSKRAITHLSFHA